MSYISWLVPNKKLDFKLGTVWAAVFFLKSFHQNCPQHNFGPKISEEIWTKICLATCIEAWSTKPVVGAASAEERRRHPYCVATGQLGWTSHETAAATTTTTTSTTSTVMSSSVELLDTPCVLHPDIPRPLHPLLHTTEMEKNENVGSC